MNVPTLNHGDRLDRMMRAARAQQYCQPGCALETVDDRVTDGVRTIRVFCREHGAKVAQLATIGGGR